MEKNSNLKIIVLSLIVLILASLCLYVLLFYKNDKITYHMEDTETFAECIKEENSDSFCKTFNLNDKIYFCYPVIDGNSSIISTLNKTIKKEIEDYISTLKSRTSDKDELANTPCGKIKILENDLMYNDSHFSYYKYKVIDSSSYISIVLYEEVLSTCASSWTDIVNVYIYDKKEDKLISNTDLKLPRSDNLIENAFKERLNDLIDVQEYKNELNNLITDRQYYLYYSEDGSMVITFSEPETNGVLVDYNFKDGIWYKVDGK